MNSRLKKAVKRFAVMQDVFANTKHEERKAERLKWQHVNLDAEDSILNHNPRLIDNSLTDNPLNKQKDTFLKRESLFRDSKPLLKQIQDEIRFWADLQSPVKLSNNDSAKPSSYKNDLYTGIRLANPE